MRGTRTGLSIFLVISLFSLTSATARDAERPSEGDTAPDVTLLNQWGESVALADLWAAGPVIVYFYPKDFTPSCTAQALDFRDAGPELQAAGLTVVGISINTVGSHRRFAETYHLDFEVLSDVGARAAEAFGVKKADHGFVIARRSTFLIDQGGEIVWIWDPAQPRKHVETVMAEAQRLQIGGFAQP